jgi:uncharacterized glyoxalase superfamily protein PhnB
MKQPAETDVFIELHVPDFAVVKEWYGKLGFSVVWERPASDQVSQGYLVMKREKAILCFYCGNEEVYHHSFFRRFPKTTPRGYGVEIALYISDQPIDEYYERVISACGSECVVGPLQQKPWGTKDFRIIDPFGYYLCVREPNNILERGG